MHIAVLGLKKDLQNIKLFCYKDFFFYQNKRHSELKVP